MKSMFNKTLGVAAGFALLAAVFGSIPTAGAAEFIAPERGGATVISATETHRNLYTAGNKVTVNSATQGDLYVAGGNVSVEGAVEQDVVAAAGDVYINGTVGGDIRVFGGTITINSAVAGDVLMFGGTLSITDKASVGGDVVSMGGQVFIDGPVAGSLRAKGGMMSINSAITGKVDITADESLVFGEKAVLTAGGKYKAPQEAEVKQGAQVGTLEFTKIAAHKGEAAAAFAGILTVAFIIKLLSMILAAFILYKLFPRTSGNLTRHTGQHFWSNAGIGLLALIIGPIASIVLMVTFVGLYAGLILLVAWGLALLVASLGGMVFAGAYITKFLSKKSDLVLDWQAVVIGVVVVTILSMIPIVGWLFCFILFVAFLGAIVRGVYHHIHNDQGGEIVVTENQ